MTSDLGAGGATLSCSQTESRLGGGSYWLTSSPEGTNSLREPEKSEPLSQTGTELNDGSYNSKSSLTPTPLNRRQYSSRGLLGTFNLKKALALFITVTGSVDPL